MNETKMNANKKDGLIGLSGMLLIGLFIFSTDPKSLSAVFLLVLPVLIAVTVFVITRLLLRLCSSMTGGLMNIISMVVATGSLLVVLLGSLGQLGSQDSLLALLLVAGLAFYFRRWGTDRYPTSQD